MVMAHCTNRALSLVPSTTLETSRLNFPTLSSPPPHPGHSVPSVTPRVAHTHEGKASSSGGQEFGCIKGRSYNSRNIATNLTCTIYTFSASWMPHISHCTKDRSLMRGWQEWRLGLGLIKGRFCLDTGSYTNRREERSSRYGDRHNSHGSWRIEAGEPSRNHTSQAWAGHRHTSLAEVEGRYLATHSRSGAGTEWSPVSRVTLQGSLKLDATRSLEKPADVTPKGRSNLQLGRGQLHTRKLVSLVAPVTRRMRAH